MKQKNKLMLYLSCGMLIFQTAICSDLDTQEQYAQDEIILTSSFKPITQIDGNEYSNLLHVDELISMNNRRNSVDLTTAIQSASIEILKLESLNKVRETLLTSYLNSNEVIAPFSMIEEKSNIKKFEQEKIKQNLAYKNIVSGGIGITSLGASIYVGKVTESLLKSEKRVFGFDDLLAASAAQSIWQAVIPTAFTAIVGYIAWRQVDYYLHAEERARLAIMQDKMDSADKRITREFTTAVNNLRKDVNAKDLELNKQIYKGLSKCDKKLDEALKYLNESNFRQDEQIKAIVHEQHEHTDDINQIISLQASAIQDHINTNRDVVNKLVAKITALDLYISQLQQTNHEMAEKQLLMLPMMERIKTMIEKDWFEDLKNIYIPSDSSEEHKDENPSASPKASMQKAPNPSNATSRSSTPTVAVKNPTPQVHVIKPQAQKANPAKVQNSKTNADEHSYGIFNMLYGKKNK